MILGAFDTEEGAMEYIINGVVKYSPVNGTLYVADSGMDMITLIRMTSELLLLFIQNNGTALNRGVILSELWEKRGLSASSNNLNNYVSMLRKALAQCGLTDIITTIPKYGFIFEAEVESVSARGNAAVDEPPVADSDRQSLSFHGLETKQRLTRHYFSPRRIMFMVSVLSLLVIIFLPGIYHFFRLQSVRTEIFTYEQCKFYITDDKTREIVNSRIIDNLRDLTAKDRLRCADKTNVYYFADKRKDSSGHVILTDLLVYCPFKRESPCDNYYLTRYKNEDENKK